MATEIVKNILEANRPKNVQLYEVSTKDIHYEPDYMLADETVGPEDTEVECLNCIYENESEQCTECKDYSDFVMKSCFTCKNCFDECAWCIGYSKYDYNHEWEEDEEENEVIELTLKDISMILQGETVNGVKLKL